MSSGISHDELAHEIERADAAEELLETVQAELALQRAANERLRARIERFEIMFDTIKHLSEQLHAVCVLGA